MILRLAATLIFVAVVVTAFGQKIVHETGSPNPFTGTLKKAIDDGGPAWFPNPTALEPEGTVIGVGGDYYNADVTVVFAKSQLPSLLPKAIHLVHSLGLPKTHILVKEGRVIGSLDFEFNEYVSFDGNRSSVQIPVGKIIQDIQTWGAPQPIGVALINRGRAANLSWTEKRSPAPF